VTSVNWSKLVVAVVAQVCVTALMATGAVDAAAGIPVITLVLGYMLGNGVAAVSNSAVQPIFARRPAAGTHLETIEVPDDVPPAGHPLPPPHDAGRMVCGQLYACTAALVIFGIVLGIVLGW
jgi:hypothetical protein